MVNESSQSSARNRRARTGTVKAISGDKTIRVAVNNLVKHPMYGKYVRRRTQLAVHDPQNAARVGDTVEVVPARRMSKTKSWRLARIVRRLEAGLDAAGQEESVR